MPEVRSAQIEEVHNEEQKRKPKVRTRPEMQEPKDQQVIEDEVRADIGSGSDMHRVRAVESVRVPELQDVEHDPVDGCDDAVHSEGSMVRGILSPDSAAGLVAFIWRVEGVDNAGDDEEEPGDGSSDFVG